MVVRLIKPASRGTYTDRGSRQAGMIDEIRGGVMPVEVDGPGWVDHSTQPIMGLFPLAVEQYLNSAVAIHAPGVTTVTTAARYYALHGLVADEATRVGMDATAARDLLRRAEVVYALACMSHRERDGHEGWLPAPHGEDRLRRALEAGPVDLDVAAGVGPGKYANASWGFWGAYRGSEMTLNVLDRDSFAPGAAFDATTVRSELGGVLDLARSATALGLDDVVHLAHTCLCRADRREDGRWLAQQFAGRAADSGTVAGVLGQTMQMIAAAIESEPVRSYDALGQVLMYGPVIAEHSRSTDIWRRWRGLRQRAESVHAWRRLWTHMCGHLPEDGAMTRVRLGELLADQLPAQSVTDYEAGLPPVIGPDDTPLPAETSPEVADRGLVDAALATLILGGHRHAAFDPTSFERLGFEGPLSHKLAVEELSPHWVAQSIDAWRPRSLRDFALYLAGVMVNRAHRVAMRKTYFRKSDQRWVVPLRVMVHDDLVIRLFGEVAREPSLRLTQLMSMARQTGLLARDPDDRWVRGPRGDLLG